MQEKKLAAAWDWSRSRTMKIDFMANIFRTMGKSMSVYFLHLTTTMIWLAFLIYDWEQTILSKHTQVKLGIVFVHHKGEKATLRRYSILRL